MKDAQELNSVVGPGPHELRAQADHIEATHPGTAQLLHEAADEIERLRAEAEDCPFEHGLDDENESEHDPTNPDCGTPGACICP